MIYRMMNQFFETWYQNLDAWIAFYGRLSDVGDKRAFIAGTKEILVMLIETLDSFERDLQSFEEEKID